MISFLCRMLSTPSRATIIVSCVFPVLATVAVALRFYARRLKALAFRTDDYAVFLALVRSLRSLTKEAYNRADNHDCYMRALHRWLVCLTEFSAKAETDFENRGCDRWHRCSCRAPRPQPTRCLRKGIQPILGESGSPSPDKPQILFVVQFCYLTNVALVRLSILLFYIQLFPTRKFRLAVYVMNTIVCTWYLAFFFATLFQAVPISINWTVQPGGKTINHYAMYTATAATETVLNIATLVFPWPIVWTLKIDTKYKRFLSGIFLLGGL